MDFGNCQESDYESIAGILLSEFDMVKCWLFKGDLGAGKTTFIKYLCKRLGIAAEAVSSPTFSIINSYTNGKDIRIWHIDLYRLNSVQELYEIGITEIVADDAWVFIEWPELATALLPIPHVEIVFEQVIENARNIKVSLITD
jgi:tRNA threonylcarbamoyladenosine biosynthesis protein TsaE